MSAVQTRVAAIVLAFAVGGAALVFARRQRRRALGGALSIPKQLWLGWTVYTWFFLAPLVAADPRSASPFSPWLAAFAIVMWIRGVAELVLLYRTKSWRPIYGITHDVFCGVLVAVGLIVTRPAALATFFGVTLVSSLVIETGYAMVFSRLVDGHTTGDDGVWFASDEPRFQRVNRVTAVLDVFVFGALFTFLGIWLTD